MIDPADKRFFVLLKRVCSETDDVPTECLGAVERAVETLTPDDLRAARLAVDAVEAETRDQILRRLHQLMATDIASIWNVMPFAKDPGRPN